MLRDVAHLTLRLAETDQDRRAAQRLRYRVFVEELGSDGPSVNHRDRLETDRFDPVCDHLILVDEERRAADLDHVVGVYRLMTEDGARRAGQFYSEDEYDLTALKGSNRRLLELGRSCIEPAYRGGPAMLQLWRGVTDYVLDRDIEILFGVASFHGTDVRAIAEPLSLLHARHLAPPELRVTAKGTPVQPMNLIAPGAIDPAGAMKAVPALIKSYLRLGGFVGEGAFVDHAFNTTDVCLVLDVAAMNPRQRAMLTEDR